MRRLLFDGTSGRGSTLLGLDEKGAVVVDSFTLGATRFCQITFDSALATVVACLGDTAAFVRP